MQRQRNNEEYEEQIEYIFRRAEEIRAEIEYQRSRSIYPEIKISGGLSDPVVREYMKRITPVKSILIGGRLIKKPEKWLEVVDKTYIWSATKGYLEIVKSRYSGEYFNETCARLGISASSYYKALDEVKKYAAIQAAYRQLIEV